MRRTVLTLLVIGLIAGASSDAAAQTKPWDKAWDDRVYLNIGFGVESGSTDLKDSKALSIYEETGTATTSTNFTSGSLFDVGIGFRLWKNLSFGVAYHQETNTADAAITGSAPHPIFFNQPRGFTGSVTGLMRRENATHLRLGWMLPFGDKLDVLVSGGPSFFRLQQDVVGDVTVAEQGAPFTQVVVNATRALRKKSVVGYNVGADAAYMVWQNDSVRIGGGFFVRYALAKAEVLLLQTDRPTDVGGLQFGFGGRIRF